MPVNSDAAAYTMTVGGTQGGTPVSGGQLVMMETGGTGAVVTCDGTKRPVGVAAQDTPVGIGARVTVYVLPGMIHELAITGSVAIAAGDDIVAAASGQINKGTLATDAGTGLLLGICVRGGTGGATGTPGAGKARFVGA
jgi:hypothetical protein